MSTETNATTPGIKYNKDGSVAKKRGRKPKNKIENVNTNNIEDTVETTAPTTSIVAEKFEEHEAEIEESAFTEGGIKTPPSTEKKNISPKKRGNTTPVCSRCGKEIKTSIYRLNLTYLTSTPTWHRNIADDKPGVCKECANELSNLIDKWFIEGGAETRFSVPKKVEADVSEAEDMTVVNNKFIKQESENKEEDFDF